VSFSGYTHTHAAHRYNNNKDTHTMGATERRTSYPIEYDVQVFNDEKLRELYEHKWIFFFLHQVKRRKSYPFLIRRRSCVYSPGGRENKTFSFDYIVMSLNNDVTYVHVGIYTV
jgi:hypothetical protein